MYAEWTSLSLTVQHFGQDTQSVLERFGLSVSKEMTLGVVKQLAGSLGITHAAEPSFLKTDREVCIILQNHIAYQILLVHCYVHSQ